ncbi:DUF4230 domain-containing protein [Paenimyroides tangerinum]|uniref:DUF4230 domain-containing protein n=2 Tax=Paenimyroides tangerinum TaxID=2488728 RepID=A0A3P3WFE1_9FLAO|nr:DUF4230 domain-containing protein [Paenimyroides tangerinum]
MKDKMKNVFRVAAVLILMFFGAMIYHWIGMPFSKENNIQPDSVIITEQLKNVSKLVVNEAKLSQIYNYKDQKSYLMNLFTFDKKAMVLVSADVQVMYDLSKLEYQIDEVNKTVKITSIPKEEIKIFPDVKVYNIEDSTFNSFKGDDYNKISEKVKAEFLKKIENSNIQTNAQNRLISELAKFLVVTNSLGWTLKYQDQIINNQTDFSIPIQG